MEVLYKLSYDPVTASGLNQRGTSVHADIESTPGKDVKKSLCLTKFHRISYVLKTVSRDFFPELGTCLKLTVWLAEFGAMFQRG